MENFIYRRAINALIPKAERVADAEVKNLNQQGEYRPGAGDRPYYFWYWDHFFHRAMKRLACEKGLRR
ncbi:hypothetical protein [Desulfotalea psychrophila]|uniref:hypothetical protein n=1 Tax=Desulfotalea psychrophila TaxID=84980 RepID=UPI000302A91A|nr:hypothetical protein [Desulfotalea psychrophila]